MAAEHARTAAGHARSAISARYDGRDEEQMVVECEKRGATAEMGKEEKEKRKLKKKIIKIFLIVLTQHYIYIYIYILAIFSCTL